MNTVTAQSDWIIRKVVNPEKEIGVWLRYLVKGHDQDADPMTFVYESHAAAAAQVRDMGEWAEVKNQPVPELEIVYVVYDNATGWSETTDPAEALRLFAEFCELFIDAATDLGDDTTAQLFIDAAFTAHRDVANLAIDDPTDWKKPNNRFDNVMLVAELSPIDPDHSDVEIEFWCGDLDEQVTTEIVVSYIENGQRRFYTTDKTRDWPHIEDYYPRKWWILDTDAKGVGTRPSPQLAAAYNEYAADLNQ